MNEHQLMRETIGWISLCWIVWNLHSLPSD